jgi:NAD(P)H-hydrate epimerase
VIEAMNRCGRPVVAVDLPSGVQADTGAVSGACVRAAVTVTFGLAKVGHLFYPGRSYCGALELVDIGFPAAAVAACPATTHLLTDDGIRALLPRRSPVAHKGSCGAVVVLAGSRGMTGAACLTADTALRCGAGRVRLAAPASLHDILEIKLTETMTHPLPEVRRHRCVSLRALGDVVGLLQGAQALAIGPGLGSHRETAELVRRLLARDDLPPTVVDADALNALGGSRQLAIAAPAAAVLTPHVGEFERLSGVSREQIAADPVHRAAEYAQQHGVTLALKGAPTIVAAADGRTFVNPTGNAGMATAGAGDVLTGLVAGLLAQGAPPLEAAAGAVYVHGLAGDLAKDLLGEPGMRAGDIGDRVPEALLQVGGGRAADS